MAKETQLLFQAFKEDHAKLGAGFHTLSVCLRGGNVDGARQAARRLNREAAAHIAFEEEHFYPALVPLLGSDQVNRMLAEHGKGLGAICALIETAQGEALPETETNRLLQDSETMERHIAECGELFEAMGSLSETEQAELFRHLVDLRDRDMAWLTYARSRGA